MLISPYDLDEKYPHIVYSKPIEAMIKLGSYYRSLFPNIKTIAVTGSIGKTTLTQIIIDVLKPHFNIHNSTGSANNVRYTFGNILKIKPEKEVYVQEVQEGPPYGCAGTISNMLKPDFAVVTKISKAHMEEFKTIERATESSFSIQAGMEESGVIITNGDDEKQENFMTKVKRIKYGIFNKNCDYYATNIEYDNEGTKFILHYDDKKITVKIFLFGEHNVYNALAAFVAGKLYGLKDEDIVKSIREYRASGIRQNLVKIDGKNFYLDCYNAASESILGAIKSIESIKSRNEESKKVAVLGDVLELGNDSESEHRKIGEYVYNSKLDIVLFYGKNMKYAYDNIINKNNLDFKKKVFWTNDESELMQLIKWNTSDEDIILVKGSHGMKLELVLDKLYGTYYNEPFRRYSLESKRCVKNSFVYMDYVDHATISSGEVTSEQPVLPKKFEDLEVTSIDRGAFTRNNFIKKLIIPNGYKCIRYAAFFKNENLLEVVIPSTVRRIEASVFSNCKKLEKLTIYEGCYFIGKRAFADCYMLKKVTLPITLKEIENNIFEGISSIEVSVYRDSNVHKILSRENYPNVNLKII